MQNIKYALTAIERVVLMLFYSKYSAQFRDDYYKNNIPELATKMFQVLDGIVAKAPQNRELSHSVWAYLREDKPELD